MKLSGPMMTGFEFHQKEVLAFDDGPFFHRSQAARKSLYVTAWRQPPLWVPPLLEAERRSEVQGLWAVPTAEQC